MIVRQVGKAGLNAKRAAQRMRRKPDPARSVRWRWAEGDMSVVKTPKAAKD